MNVDTADTSASAPIDKGPADVPAGRQRRRKTWNVLAVLALVSALVASPLAVVFGYIAVGQIHRSDQRGLRMAWAAVALGWLWAVVFVVLAVALVTIWRENPFWP